MAENEESMDSSPTQPTPPKLGSFLLSARALWNRVPIKARVVLGLFLCAAFLLALHTAFATKDASLHLRVQHNFRSADLSVWVDSNLVYSGKLRGTLKKKLGLIPDSVQGTLSEVFSLSSGAHQVRVRIASEDGSTEEDSISADFAPHSKRELSAVARHNGVALSWQSAEPVPAASSEGWFARYAGTLFLTAAGSIISALTGFALKEIPSHIRSRQDAEPKTRAASAGQ
jgi:hypothetical protein